MPELPEVEIVRKSLNKKISGKIINDVRVKNRNLRLKIPKNFETNLKRKKIKKTCEQMQISTVQIRASRRP